MAGDDLKLESRFSDSRGSFPYIAAAFAALAIVGIVIVTTTDVASKLLPMNDAYRDVLVPTTADGSMPLSLQTLNQKADSKTLTVEGTVMNRTESTIKGLLAVVQVKDRFTLPGPTVEVPIEPAELASKAIGKFQTTITLGDNGLSGYDVQFKLPNDGPFVPHKDEHPLEPVPEIKKTK
jgi:hypothetical protein